MAILVSGSVGLARAFEGRRPIQDPRGRPGWTLWREGVPEGETIDEVAARVDRVIAELPRERGCPPLAPGHLLRALTARWLGLEPRAGALRALDQASISALGYERETSVHRL